MKKLLYFILPGLVFACSTQSAEPVAVTPEEKSIDHSAELAKMEKTRNSFMTALKEKRYGDIRQVVTSDLQSIGPATPAWQKMRDLGKERGVFPYDSIIMSPIETVVLNDTMAYDFGTSKVYYTNENGEQVELQDTFLALMKKEADGEWRLFREVASGQVKEK